MFELQDKEIELISTDIEQQGLTFIPLKNELLDHICCQIELDMDNGMTFNEAYRKVKASIGRKRIRQVQDETLTLINKKYRRMKRTMYALGVASPIMLLAAAVFKINHWPGAGILISFALFITGIIFLPVFVMVRIRNTRNVNEPVPLGIYITGMIAGMITIIGTLFKIQHWPGASILVSVGLITLALIFLPLYARYKIRETKKDEKSVNRIWIGGTIAGILFILGALFKIMHWPGAGIVIISSWTTVAIVLLPFVVLNQLRQEERQVNNFFNILLVTTTVAIFILALTRATPWYYVAGYFTIDHQFVKTEKYLASKTNEYLDKGREGFSPEVIDLTAESDEIYRYIRDMRKELVDLHSDEDQQPLKDGQIDVREMYPVGKSSKPYNLIIERDQNILFEMLTSFKKHAETLSDDNDLKEYLDNHLGFQIPDPFEPDEWWEHCFTGPLMHSLGILASYEAAVRFVERELLMANLE